MDYTTGPNLKLDRATEHLVALDRKLKRFNRGKPYRFVGKHDPKTGEYVVRLRVRKRPPPDWGLLIGDCVHNARSCLDYLMGQLIRFTSGGEPTEYTAFPIFKKKPPAKQWADKVEGLGGLTEAALEGLQPYKAPDPASEPLWLLKRLSNFDKHRFLQVATLIGEESSVAVVDPGGVVEPNVLVSYGPFERDTEIARLPDPEGQMDVYANISYLIAFDEEGPAAGRPIIDTLGTILLTVGEILTSFNIAVAQKTLILSVLE